MLDQPFSPLAVPPERHYFPSPSSRLIFFTLAFPASPLLMLFHQRWEASAHAKSEIFHSQRHYRYSSEFCPWALPASCMMAMVENTIFHFRTGRRSLLRAWEQEESHHRRNTGNRERMPTEGNNSSPYVPHSQNFPPQQTVGQTVE